MIPKSIGIELPLTIDEAVTTILNDLPLLDRTRLSAMGSDELYLIDREIGSQIAKDFRLWNGNDILLSDCLVAAQKFDEPTDPTFVIIHAVWQKLQDTHVLRLVKS
ncbi:hypothetical protein DSCA_48970 [Desulfosarcina alkanivorans]|jgi:hypothetical protein|uniref:DUF6794 domain-containing protein n=1 Tax=Desulfosarcina alkanivorans TaxID=571177 RepID=A0A5K7Z2U1_9BACT|nr:DUF6794 domain-containing protein [Desulfosarcina alkanivorans]BBO70967.1 hypothetical protein DSCA_48970 [Desulfosarcina alkanivorans]